MFFIIKGHTRLAPVLQCQLLLNVSFIIQPFAKFKLLVIKKKGNRTLNKTTRDRKTALLQSWADTQGHYSPNTFK